MSFLILCLTCIPNCGIIVKLLVLLQAGPLLVKKRGVGGARLGNFLLFIAV